MDVPETRYALTDDGVHIAYHVVGDGPVDIVWIHSFNGGLELQWEHPLIPALTAKLNTFARVIRHDMRGTGLSDRYAGLPDLETEARDVIAVLDAAGSRSTVIVSAGNVVAPLVAATYPRRVRALCLFDPEARGTAAEGSEWGISGDEARADIEAARDGWGTDAYAAEFMEAVAPSLAGDRELIRWYARLQRHWVAPGDAVELLRRSYETDIRDVLPSIGVPTLCIVRQFEEGIEAAEYVARTIPGATLVTLPGSEHYSAAGDQDALVAAIRNFIGVAPSGVASGRALRAVLFTDIVGSTETAFRLGVDEWKALLERHHELVRSELASFDGDEVDTAGDGFYATFEGPAAAVRCAEAIARKVRDLGIEIRAGVHVGECEVIDGHLGGPTAAIGARVGALSGPSEVLVSRTVKDLVAGSGLAFEDAGEHELKGVPDRWRLYRVVHP
ncbi:MAG: adenylate/guanylate cyclase domain-containing protein [Actinomycetota bacterium]